MTRALGGWAKAGLGALCAVGVVGASPPASAELGVVHPELQRAAAAARAAKGPEAYAALREVWRLWDRADPAQVEEAIASMAQSRSAPPPVRVYASLLEAFARRRRGDLDGASARIAKLGFVGKWITIGAFDNEGKAGFTHAYGPETDLIGPVDMARAHDGKERPARWRVPPIGAPFGWLDLGEVVRPRENVCAYATTFLSARAGTRAPRKITLWAGAAGAFRVWWNGEAVLEDTGYRELDIDRFAAAVTLQPGKNRLMVKVCGTDEAPKLALRVADEKGEPDLGVDVAAEPTLSGTATKADTSAKRPLGGLPIAPMAAFEKLVEGTKAPPAMLEAYARYLAVTGGESRPEHRARDLSQRAADAAPTVKRLLLAGQLAEDRNQTRDWVDRAAAVGGARDLDVLLAQAQIARSGANWRDAVPVFEKILALDPDHVGATLGLVELYVEAGLKRTALATLERAVARQPKSVALLRIYASELRTLGRDVEAGEVEARYAALRFDDSTFLNQQIELSSARRDKEGAERWIGRFLSGEPDSTWALGVAARAYRALGQKQRAVATYQRALAIAPDDTATLRALADLHGEDERRDEQEKLLRQILALSPQSKDVREYLEHLEPPKPRADEAYAWAPERFLALRGVTDAAYPKRTLRSLTVTTVFPNGLASRFRQVVFQPLTEEAAAAAREYAFDYQADKQAVQIRASRVYRKSGKIDEAIESGESGANNPALAMYTSTRTVYVHFPRLEAGDVVELRYRVEDVAPRNEIADHYGEVEVMGTDEPVANSEYVLITPKARAFQVDARSVPGVQREETEQGDQRVHRFFAEKVDALAGEPVMPPWAEVLPHVHVSTFKSWDEVGAFYWGLSRDQLDTDDEVRRRVREIVKGKKDDMAKVRAIYKYATRLRYVALELGLEGIKPRRCAQTIARGWGDCKDKATVIVTMLREAGIPATLVLVRTGMRGDIADSPASLAPFDHAIAYVPSLDLYLDGTAEHTGVDELPVMDRGAFALQINEGKPKLVRLPQPSPDRSLSRKRLEVALAPDGSGQFSIDLNVAGAYAPTYRQRYLADGVRRERAQRDLSAELGPLELAKGAAGLELNDLDDEDQPVRLRAKGRVLSFARRDGDALVIPAGPARRLVADYASLSRRGLDIDLQALTQKDDEWTLKLPPGAKITRAPQPAQMDTPFGRFSITFEESAGKVVIKSSLAFKKARIKPAEYAAWRAFCEAVDRGFGQTMVVSR